MEPFMLAVQMGLGVHQAYFRVLTGNLLDEPGAEPIGLDLPLRPFFLCAWRESCRFRTIDRFAKRLL